MNQILRTLLVEDFEDDALLLVRELRKGGYDPVWRRICTADRMREALHSDEWDIIICDYSMPAFNAFDALRIGRESGRDLPFIIVSGAVGEDVAVKAMKAGAHDYLMKSNLTRLVPAITREINEAQERRERRKAEEALRQAQKTESLGLMAGGIAHDFNNLLVALLAQNSLALAKLPPDSPARSHVDKAIMAAERAADLTRQMLNYAGYRAGTEEAVNLNEMVEANLALLSAALPKTVQLHAQLAGGLPEFKGDQGQIQQVVMNLILNAAEAIQDDRGNVFVATESRDISADDSAHWSYVEGPPCPGEHIVLTVSDDGVGMDGATQSRIFDPFFTTKKRGRGLGLAAVLGIVRGHKGSLQVTSTVGQGTTFRLFFPASKPVPTTETRGQLRTHYIDGRTTGLILVIDDEEPIRQAVVDILAFSGMEALTAASGDAGIALFRERADDIQLVLLDLSMPGMSGSQTLRELQQLAPDLPVIVSSGHDRSEAVKRLGTPWKVEFLQKPYSVDTLLDSVMKHAVPAAAAVQRDITCQSFGTGMRRPS